MGIPDETIGANGAEILSPGPIPDRTDRALGECLRRVASIEAFLEEPNTWLNVGAAVERFERTCRRWEELDARITRLGNWANQIQAEVNRLERIVVRLLEEKQAAAKEQVLARALVGTLEPPEAEPVEERDGEAPRKVNRIENLDLRLRTYNCLKKAGLDQITQLVATSPSDLLFIRNFGHRSVRDVREALTRAGIPWTAADKEEVP